VGRGVVCVGQAAPHYFERRSTVPGRRRLKMGYGIQTWCNRVDELLVELGRYEAEGEIKPSTARLVKVHLEEARAIMRRRYNKSRVNL